MENFNVDVKLRKKKNESVSYKINRSFYRSCAFSTFRRVRKIAKSDSLRRVCPSVCTHETTLLPLDRFS
jgi:hypothetical protein